MVRRLSGMSNSTRILFEDGQVERMSDRRKGDSSLLARHLNLVSHFTLAFCNTGPTISIWQRALRAYLKANSDPLSFKRSIAVHHSATQSAMPIEQRDPEVPARTDQMVARGILRPSGMQATGEGETRGKWPSLCMNEEDFQAKKRAGRGAYTCKRQCSHQTRQLLSHAETLCLAAVRKLYCPTPYHRVDQLMHVKFHTISASSHIQKPTNAVITSCHSLTYASPSNSANQATLNMSTESSLHITIGAVNHRR